jgi:hypothetical protein
MEIKINIRDCIECRHLSNTGAFTEGGAKPCCNHDVTCKIKGYDCFKRIINNTNTIPIWCPLKDGAPY